MTQLKRDMTSWMDHFSRGSFVGSAGLILESAEVVSSVSKRVKTQSCNWDPTEMWWGGTLRIRKHLLVPRGFRDEWSQSAAGPHSWLQRHTITMPSASWRRVTHCGREPLSSATPPNHKAISGAEMLHPVQNPLGLPLGLFFIPLLSSLLTLHYLPCYIPVSFSFFLPAPSPPSPPSPPPLHLSRLCPAQ